MQKYSHLPQLEVGILFSPEITIKKAKDDRIEKCN